MTSHDFLPFAPDWQSLGGHLVVCPSATDRDGRRTVVFDDRRAEGSAHHGGPAPAWLSRAMFEVADTVRVILLILHVMAFVAALLAKDHARRLWRRALGRDVRDAALAPSTGAASPAAAMAERTGE
jgi:hypothetical protein